MIEDLQHILFLDIETVPNCRDFSDLSPSMQILWDKKTKKQRGDSSAEDFYQNAGIWAEFGKIVCISVGFIKCQKKHSTVRVRSFHGNEYDLLMDFKVLLETYFSKKPNILCAHNGKEFDFPFIARRMIIHQISLPEKLNLSGKKPWEIPHIDTLEMWKFGDYKNFVSLDLLTQILNIPSPKDDIDGSQVCHIYYEDDNIDRIVKYCEQDVIALTQVFLRLSNKPLLKQTQIVHV